MAIKELFSKKDNGWELVDRNVRETIINTLKTNNIKCVEINELNELFDIYQKLRIEYARESGLIGNNKQESTSL